MGVWHHGQGNGYSAFDADGWNNTDAFGLSNDKIKRLVNRIRATNNTVARLRRQIENLDRKIKKRLNDIRTNPDRPDPLKDRDPRGPEWERTTKGAEPKRSVQGHRNLINQDRKDKAKRMRQLREAEARAKALVLELTGLQAAERAKKKLCQKIAKKGAKAIVSKIPGVGIGFFLYDTYKHGIGHATNEALCGP